MNRQERRARAAQDRNRASCWRAGLPGEMHVGGGYEEALKCAGGKQNVVTIAAALGNATVKSAIPVDKIDAVLDLPRKVEAKLDKRTTDPRQSAMSFVIRAFKENQHLTADTGSIVVSTLFWLACTRQPQEVDDYVLEHARAGGAIISWEITEGDPGHGNNWRLMIDALPGDVAHVPTPKHPMPGHPGGPPLSS